MEEQPSDVRDPTSVSEWAAEWTSILTWKLIKLVIRLSWKLISAIAVSIGAALILLVGVNAVVGFGILGLAFVITLVMTALRLVVVFIVCWIVSVVALAAILRASAYLASRRIVLARRWLRLVQRRLRMGVRRMRALSRTQPRTEQEDAVFGTVLIMAVLLMVAYLTIRDAKLWPTLRLPMRAPVGRVGRSEMPLRVSTLADVATYINARRNKIAARVNTIAPRTRADQPLTSRCGNVFPPHPAEARLIAELYVDLTEAPPIVKREYILTEEQLTAALSSILTAQLTRYSLDCVKLHRDYIRFFTTSADADGTAKNKAFGVSVVKDGGRLRMVLEEFSIGRASFQVGWLGLGVAGGREGLVSDLEGGEWLEDALRALDSRVFSIEVFEGYLRIVTWRLPSVVAARAAIDAGYTQRAVEHRVEPADDAASSGVIRAGDLVYVLQRRDEWLYVCSEVSGRFGWLPRAAFTSLEKPVKDTPHITVQPFLAATPDMPDAISPKNFSFVALDWQCRLSAEGDGRCHDGKSTWRFRLPVDDGRIDRLYVSPGDPLVLAYSLTDEESSWGKLAGIMPRARRPAWATQVSGLNLAVPVASTDSVHVAALAFVASLNRRTGSFQWRHDYVYDGSGRTVIQLAVENNVVRVTAKSWRADDAETVCYDFATGIVVVCSAARVE